MNLNNPNIMQQVKANRQNFRSIKLMYASFMLQIHRRHDIKWKAKILSIKFYGLTFVCKNTLGYLGISFYNEERICRRQYDFTKCDTYSQGLNE